MSEQNVIVGVTGASGAVYAKRLVNVLLSQELTVHFIPTAHASVTWNHEMERNKKSAKTRSRTPDLANWQGWLEVPKSALMRLMVYSDKTIEAPLASGTFDAHAMIVVPCSMNTLGKIAHGISDTLLTRAAAVCLKERRRLILVPRETPLSLIDLKNMTALAEAGAVLLPAMPGFYHTPKKIDDLVDFIVAKICSVSSLPCSLPIQYL